MKSFATLTLTGPFALMALLGGCAAHRERGAPAAIGEAHDGWLVFGREFQLYEKKADIGRKYDQSCYSGIFDTLHRHHAAARFDGRYVRIVGRLISARAYFGETGLGARAENYCARDQILIAYSISAATDPSARAP